MNKKSLKISKENKEKIIIYGGNFLGGFLKVGNPVAGVLYGTLDIGNYFLNKLKGSIFNRISKATGAVYFLGSGVFDALSAAKGDYMGLAELPFDASMGYVLAKDAIGLYKNKSVSGDLSKIKTKAKKTYEEVKPRIQNLKKSLEDKFDGKSN
ncbi:hypothetical protein J4411_01345 [Candidatus Pacearchaeota archaeon]|nr:hypothetical protein [uncultured archaeon]MBS3084539.1 hypothetical protein [Candidatus Pacearchaeota archaeon]